MKKLYKITSLILIVGIMVFVFPNKAEAAIAFDATSTVDADGCLTDVSTPFVLSWSHTITGTNTLLVVGEVHSNTFENATGVTYNGVSMTNIRTDSNVGGTENTLWYLANPTSGANTITVTYDASIFNACANAVSLTGVNQTTPLDAHNGTNVDSANSVSTTVTTVVDNAWLVDIVGISETAAELTVGANQTERQNLQGGSYDHGMSTVNGKTPAGDEAMDWNDGSDPSTFQWTISVASFAPVATAAAAATPQLSIIDSQYFKVEDGFLSIIN